MWWLAYLPHRDSWLLSPDPARLPSDRRFAVDPKCVFMLADRGSWWISMQWAARDHERVRPWLYSLVFGEESQARVRTVSLRGEAAAARFKICPVRSPEAAEFCTRSCPYCSGRRVALYSAGLGSDATVERPCARCGGVGRVEESPRQAAEAAAAAGELTDEERRLQAEAIALLREFED